MRPEQNHSSAYREPSPMSDYDGYYTDFDGDTCEAADAIESLHNSPVKELSSLLHKSLPSLQSNKLPSSHSLERSKSEGAFAYPSIAKNQGLGVNRALASSSFPQQPPYPSTPTRKRGAPSAVTGTPSSRRLGAIQQSLQELGLNSPRPVTPKMLFPEASANIPTTKGREPLPLYEISDEETDEVTKILTDTDTSADDRVGGSLSSIGSSYSLPLNSSFQLSASLRTKRTGDAQPTSSASPSKYRKLTDREATPIRKKMSGPKVVNDLFTAAPPSPGSTARPPSHSDGFSTQDLTEGPSVLKDFLAGALGVDLTPVIIAHDVEVQALMDEAGIAWGVQYEIALGISRGYWEWSHVKSKISMFKSNDPRGSAPVGSNYNVADKVRSIILGVRHKPSDPAVWKELDREQDAIMENCGRGLGVMGAWRGEPDWYGGQVQQLARLAHNEGMYKIHLDPMEKRRSYRMARYYGSRRILQLRIPDDMMQKEGDKVREFLLQKFILCGRVFAPFFAKENGVYLVETDENFERRPVAAFGDNHRKSLKDLVTWHNDLELNKDQPIRKWYARKQLAFSDSIPALKFEEENIHAIDDKYAPWSGHGKPPAEKIHTDGCGYINAAALKIITRLLGMSHLPTAVQGRLEGSKGLWILHPTDNSAEPRIWIRTSQKKILYRYPLSRAHLIFDLLSVSRFSPPIKLSKQSIMNLSENGVGDEVLTELMVQGLMDEVGPLMRWAEPQAMETLWHCVNQLGGVSRSRLSRLTTGLGRALGLQRREWGHEDIGMETEEDSLNVLKDEQAGAYTGRNEFSGAPLSIHEVTLELIQAGFRPDELEHLWDKIRCIVDTTIKYTMDKYSIPLPESLGAFIVPDPLDILEEGEVYYRSSQSLTDPETQTLFNIVTGDVLLGRYPVRLPSDIQKVKAVDRAELFNYMDVLIVSTKGDVSLASLLAGGDCDGDDLFIIREKSIVEPFKSKPLAAMPPNLLEENFEGHPERVEEFAKRVAPMSPHERQKAFQEILLLNLNDSKVGLYSMFHDFAVWKYGYANTESIRLAYMFNTLLDSSKTGLRLKPGVFDKDRARFGSQVPETQQGNARRFIFHTLRNAGETARDNLLSQYKDLGKASNKEVRDPDLLRPYNTISFNALQYYEHNTKEHRLLLTDELGRIRAVVEEARELYAKAMAKLGAAKEKTDKSPTKKKSKKKSQREPNPFLQASKLFDQDVPDIKILQNIREIKASFAYHRHPGFAFSVAFRDLCLIKAQASFGGLAPTIRSFDQAKTIPSTYVKTVTRIAADRL